MISSWDGAKGTVLIGSGEDYCFHPLLGPRDGRVGQLARRPTASLVPI